MLTFTFSETLSARLAAGRKALLDFTPVLRTIADKMRSNAVLNFEAETGPDGVRWKPSRRAIEDGGLTLTDTGQLRQSIVAASDDTTAIAGTNLIYAAIHQFGGPLKRTARPARGKVGPRVPGRMPARPFMGFSPEDVVDIEFLLEDHLDRAFNGGAR